LEENVMRRLLLILAAMCSLSIFATDAQARIGWGWRGPGYYPGVARPYATYGYRPWGGYYGGYYGGYAPYGYGPAYMGAYPGYYWR
jgi:hypothetical protein